MDVTHDVDSIIATCAPDLAEDVKGQVFHDEGWNTIVKLDVDRDHVVPVEE